MAQKKGPPVEKRKLTELKICDSEIIYSKLRDAIKVLGEGNPVEINEKCEIVGGYYMFWAHVACEEDKVPIKVKKGASPPNAAKDTKGVYIIREQSELMDEEVIEIVQEYVTKLKVEPRLKFKVILSAKVKDLVASQRDINYKHLLRTIQHLQKIETNKLDPVEINKDYEIIRGYPLFWAHLILEYETVYCQIIEGNPPKMATSFWFYTDDGEKDGKDMYACYDIIGEYAKIMDKGIEVMKDKTS